MLQTARVGAADMADDAVGQAGDLCCEQPTTIPPPPPDGKAASRGEKAGAGEADEEAALRCRN